MGAQMLDLPKAEISLTIFLYLTKKQGPVHLSPPQPHLHNWPLKLQLPTPQTLHPILNICLINTNTYEKS